jgi:hypothetical protein
MPTASNHCATLRSRAAAAETKKRTRPPKRSRMVENTSRSATLYASDHGSEGFFPACRAADTFKPTPTDQRSARQTSNDPGSRQPGDAVEDARRLCRRARLACNQAAAIGRNQSRRSSGFGSLDGR